MDTINKKGRSANILVFINYAVIILLAYLIYRFKFDLFSFGGSLMLAAVTFMLIFLKRVVKPLALESSSAALMVTGLLVINVLSYWEISGKRIDMPYLTISFICLYLFVAISAAVLGLPFKKIDNVSEADQPVYRQIMRTISMPMYVFGLIFAMLSGLAVYDILKSEPNVAVSMPFLKIAYVTVAWIVIALLVIYIYLLKFKDEDIRKFLLEEKLDSLNYDIKKVKKYFAIFYSLIIVFGSVIETQRGMWILWIETILSLGFLSLIILKIYKHILREQKGRVLGSTF